jgi:hypothetical protein
MKAVYFEAGGAIDVLQYGDMEAPDKCRSTQVLVRVKAIGINPLEQPPSDFLSLFRSYRAVTELVLCKLLAIR